MSQQIWHWKSVEDTIWPVLLCQFVHNNFVMGLDSYNLNREILKYNHGFNPLFLECNWAVHSYAISGNWITADTIHWIISGIRHVPNVKFA